MEGSLPAGKMPLVRRPTMSVSWELICGLRQGGETVGGFMRTRRGVNVAAARALSAKRTHVSVLRVGVLTRRRLAGLYTVAVERPPGW